MLPTTEQFLRAKGHMQWGAERALLAHYTHSPNLCEAHKVDCINELKAAAKALGYELVEVVSTFAKDNDGNNIEAAIPVTPAARDGGRMQMEDAES